MNLFKKLLFSLALVGSLSGTALGQTVGYGAAGPGPIPITSVTITPSGGGTGITSYTIGDMIYASAATTLSKLADVAVGSVLVSGGVATAPAYSSTPTVTSITLSGLTSGRIPIVSTAGLITDSAGLTYNSGTGTLTTTTFVGALTGNATTATSATTATTATTATNATNVATTSTSTNASYYPTFVASSSTGNQALGIDAGITFNPSTHAITANTITGNTALIGGTVSGSTITGTDLISNSYSSNATDRGFESTNTSTASSALFIFRRQHGAGTIVSNADFTGGVIGKGYDGAAYIDSGIMGFVVDGTPGTNDMPGKFVVYTTPDGTTTDTLGFSVRQNQAIEFNGSQYATCTALTTSSNVVGCTPSDARLKDDKGVLTPASALSRVLALPDLHEFTFKTYQDFNTSTKKNETRSYGPEGEHYGFFAQDIMKVEPQLVHRSSKTPLTPDGQLQFDKGEVTPLALAAIKELEQENKDLRVRLSKVEDQLKHPSDTNSWLNNLMKWL